VPLQASGLKAQQEPHPGEIDADDPVPDLDLVLAYRHLEAPLPEAALHERLEHPLRRSGVRVPQVDDVSQGAETPPAVTGLVLQAPLQPGEQLGVPAEG
jgi:hypothetical protein